MAKILIVEDDLGLSQVLRDCLESEEHRVQVSNDGFDAGYKLRTYEYDLIVLDWDIPIMNGLEVLKDFRSRGGMAPILMITGKSHIDEKEVGFASGADDYLIKPLQLGEFKSRVKALLRHPHVLPDKTMKDGKTTLEPTLRKTLKASGISLEPSLGKTLKAGDITLEPSLGKTTRAGKEIPLSKKEFALLEFLMRHPKQVFSAEALLRSVWRAEDLVGPETIRTHVKSIKAKIDTPGQSSLLTSVFGVGYKVDVEVE